MENHMTIQKAIPDHYLPVWWTVEMLSLNEGFVELYDDINHTSQVSLFFILYSNTYCLFIEQYL